MPEIENLTIWWTDVRLERNVDGELHLTDESFERPVIVIDNQAFLVFKLTFRMNREGYVIKDWKEAGLSRPSIIRTDAFVPVHRSDMKYMMGTLSDRDINDFIQYMKDHPAGRVMQR